jgi:class 3 adenylate cyclase
MTVFFADLVGFTAMTNELGPDKSYEIVNSFFQKANETLVRHDAFVDKFIGDAVMAIFNVPIRNADHVQRAVAAGMELQTAIQELRERHRRNLQIRVGIAAGFARVGRIGSSDRRDYTAIGDVVNLASRLETLARPGEIMINEAGYDRIAAQHPETDRESFTVKGFEGKVGAYRLLRRQTPIQQPGDDSGTSGPQSVRRITVGALLFAVLGAPCMVTSVLGPLSLLLGVGAFFGATAHYFAVLDQPAVQIPLHVLAVIGSSLNLYMIWYGYRRHRDSADPVEQLDTSFHRRGIVVGLLSIFSLVFVLTELFFHLVLHHRLTL